MNRAENIRWLRPVRREELGRLATLAERDNHALIAPTHVFEKGSELVGYASIGLVPLVLPWFDTQRCKAADSLYYINQMENLVANAMPDNGQNLMAVPVAQDSPFAPFIAKLGYVDAGGFRLTFKKVR